jgi:Ala-tRNA(Pro) deacylase
MELFERIIALLDGNKIEYKLLEHEPVYTSEQAAAARTDVSLHQGAKAMIVRIKKSEFPPEADQPQAERINGGNVPDTDYVMCVLPGDRKIDFKKLKSVLSARDVTLADPSAVEKTVGVKIGAVSPFGNLSGLTVLLDESICDNEEIVFNVGDHCKSVKMKLSDYLRLVNPQRLSFSK